MQNNNYQKTSPLVVFPYNRPQHLQLTLEALGRCVGYSECPLYIFCDAPKSAKDFIGTRAVQAVAHAWVGMHGGTVIERKENYGFRNITEGITEICAKYGRVIVIEEDIVVSPDFLTYMRLSLDKYESDSRVQLISGYILPDTQPPLPSTFFLPTPFIWGWGTWQRVWENYSWHPKGCEEFLKDSEKCYRFNYKNGRSFSDMLKRAITCNPPGSYTWDVQLAYTIFSQNGLALHPSHSLVWNTGMACGAHGQLKYPTVYGKDPLYHGKLEMDRFLQPGLEENWSFPSQVAVDEMAYDRISRAFRKDKHLKKYKRWWSRFKAKF